MINTGVSQVKIYEGTGRRGTGRRGTGRRGTGRRGTNVANVARIAANRRKAHEEWSVILENGNKFNKVK